MATIFRGYQSIDENYDAPADFEIFDREERLKTESMKDHRTICNIFTGSLLAQLLAVGMLSIPRSVKGSNGHDAVVVLIVALQIALLASIVYGTGILVRNLSTVTLSDVWRMYFATAFGFSGVYMVIFLSADKSFVAIDPHILLGKPSSVYIAMLYVSVSQQTHTGYGDITTVGFVPQLISSIQMLVGILYTVFIISHTQELFFARFHIVGVRPRKESRTICGRCWDIFTKNECIKRMRRWVREYLVIISFVIWISNYLMLQYLEPNVFGNWQYRIGVIFMECVFQMLQIGSVIMTSWKFVRHVDEITTYFLAQAFVAICLTFSGLYNLFFAFAPANDKAFSLIDFEVGKTSPESVISQLLYFSVATMTSSGFGDIYPRKWHTQLLVSLQMLLAVFFVCIALGRGVSIVTDNRRLHATRRNIYAEAGIIPSG